MNNNPKLSGSKWSGPWVYFALAFAVSWLIEIVLAISGIDLKTVSGQMLLSLAAAGPAIAAVSLTYLTQDEEGRHDYWRRITDVRRISAGWYLVILLFPSVLFGISEVLDILTGGKGGTWGEQIVQFSSIPVYLIITLIIAPFLEEMGWRGYALDRLQLRWSALISSLILGTVWALWHLPVFFIKSTYQYSLGVGSLAFWTYMISIVPLTIFFTWVFNNNNRSTLAAILLHITVNTTAEIFSVTEQAYTYSIAVSCVAAAAIVVIWGAKTLRRQDNVVQPHNPFSN